MLQAAERAQAKKAGWRPAWALREELTASPLEQEPAGREEGRIRVRPRGALLGG